MKWWILSTNFMKNTNSNLISKFFFFVFLWSFTWGCAQDSLRVMTYNLMLFPEGTTYSRTNYLRAILDSYRPDIFAVCEVETEAAADTILYRALRPLNSSYEAAQFEWCHSNPNSTLQQMLFYNSEKLELVSQTYLMTSVRDINHYTLALRTLNMQTDTVFVDVFVMHLKASSGDQNEQKRLEMVNVLTQDLINIPAGHHVLVTGDFNIYYSDEPAYQELMDTTNAIVLKDPVNRPGYWNNNRSFSDLHTQSPNTNKGGNFVGGGLDDRFDFILVSQELMQSSGDLYYRTGSYSAYGNNGNCFNDDINDPGCSGYYSQSLRDNLWEMSDHLPVVLTLYTDRVFKAEKHVLKTFQIVPNPASDYIRLENPDFSGSFYITDMSGKIVKEQTNYNGENWYIGDLKSGMYYVLSRQGDYKPVAFIKE